MHESLFTFTFAVIVVSFAGCAAEPSPEPQPKQQSQSGDGTTTKASPAPTEKDTNATEPLPAPEPCVTKDSVANDKGIGAYCDATTKCATKGQVCTGDFGAGTDASFCTKLCAEDAECGTGARCFHHEQGSACVLDACLDQ